MSKRYVSAGLFCTFVLALAAVAGGQDIPQPVVRLGNAIELADDVWVNFIGTADIRFQYVHNRDFEDEIRDRPTSRDNTATSPHTGSADIWWVEARLGADMQYRKHLKFRVLMENQMTWDGSRIDNGFGLGGSDTDFDDGRDLNCGSNGVGCLQRNTWNLERLWIDYKFEGTPLRFRVGADLWFTDPAGVVGDDDPRFAVFAKFGDVELSGAVVLQTSSLRAGLTDDNDDMYYTFGVTYDRKPWRFGVDAAYFRFRFNQNQNIDTAIIMPSVVGSVGIVRFLAQPMVVIGSADSKVAGEQDYDVMAVGFIGNVELNLGRIRPFVSMVYGSGDGDPDDGDLEAFAPLPQPEITLTVATPFFSTLISSSTWGARDVFPPAAVNMGSGFEFLHAVGNPWSDLSGRSLGDVSTTHSNPGVLTIAPGVKIALAKGHQLDVYYIYRRVMDTEPIERELVLFGEASVSVDESMTHELAASYTWKPNPWFDVRLYGSAVIPSEGVKDIASAQDCGGSPCDGEDVSLFSEVRVRARF